MDMLDIEAMLGIFCMFYCQISTFTCTRYSLRLRKGTEANTKTDKQITIDRNGVYIIFGMHFALFYMAYCNIYIIGGTGKMGVTLAKWLVEQKGVKHLILTYNNNDASNNNAIAELKKLADVLVVKANVTILSDVESVIASTFVCAVPL